MAVFTKHSLYPGTIETAMPAFVVDDGEVKVYFDFSPYNNPTAEPATIKQDYIQVSLRYQNSNLNALLDPSGIVLKSWYLETNEGERYHQYYFTLTEQDLKDGEFYPYQYYKLQFRLTDAAASNIDTVHEQSIDSWLSSESLEEGKTNLDESSEWSTVCLIRGITEMIVEASLEGTVSREEHSGYHYVIVSSGFSKIFGKINFVAAEDGSKCDEYLKKMHIQVEEYNLETDEETPCYDSGDIYIDKYQDINEFSHEINYYFKTLEEGYTYNIYITYTTNNLYEYQDIFAVDVESNESLSMEPKFNFIPLEEEGLMGLVLEHSSNWDASYIYSIYRYDVYRKKTEKLYDLDFYNFEGVSETYMEYLADATPESGIVYIYYLVMRDKTGTGECTPRIFALPFYSENIPAVFLDHIFLKQKNFQLKIKYNPNINSMKTTYAENKIDTLGSQYPFIKRNGAIKYKTFPISGLITHFMDEHHFATSREEILGAYPINSVWRSNNKTNNTKAAAAGSHTEDLIRPLLSEPGAYTAEVFNRVRGINENYDYTYERLFKDKIMEYLENGEVFLFRSPTEGNMLIRLMDVSLTPVQTLGRMLWSFSATAYEIDECSLDNINKYNLRPLIALNSNSTDIHREDQYEPTWIPNFYEVAFPAFSQKWSDYTSKQEKLLYRFGDNINSYHPKRNELRTDSLEGTYYFEEEVPFDDEGSLS